jgi:hypothetical protein
MKDGNESIDFLNYWSIVLLERLGNLSPTQEQIDLVALLLFGTVNPSMSMPLMQQGYH